MWTVNCTYTYIIIPLYSTLNEARGKEFTPAVVFKPIADEVKGLHSLDEYQSKEEEYAKLDQMRQLGLTNEEIK